MQTSIAPTTARTATAFLKPLAENGMIPSAEYKALANAIEKAATPTAPKTTKPGLITFAEAAHRLGCCKRTVARMANEGRLTRHYLRPGSVKSQRLSAAEVAGLCGGTQEASA